MIDLQWYSENRTKFDGRAIQLFIGRLVVWFSYNTVIAFKSPLYRDNELFIRENVWSKTTGKHLNAINPDKSIRVSQEVFERNLKNCLYCHNLLP